MVELEVVCPCVCQRRPPSRPRAPVLPLVKSSRCLAFGLSCVLPAPDPRCQAGASRLFATNASEHCRDR
eukprot:7691564-Alexandrium_andersonii.AAC.1